MAPFSRKRRGNTYVEVDLSSQYLWCVVNGKTVVSTSVVTGTTSANRTPSGTYYFLYKTHNETLKEVNNTDGGKYATKVKYWMPFYNGDGCRMTPGGKVRRRNYLQIRRKPRLCKHAIHSRLPDSTIMSKPACR